MKGIIKFALALASLAIIPSAHATICPEGQVVGVCIVPYGGFFELNVGYPALTNLNLPSNTNTNFPSKWGIGAVLGYKFMPFFAAEFGYTKYATSDIKNAAGVVVAKDSHYTYQLAARGILPIGDSGLELFAKLGIVRLVTRLTVNDNAGTIVFNSGPHNSAGVYMGVGADYGFTPSFLANIQWNRAKGTNSTGTLDLYSIGITVFMF